MHFLLSYRTPFPNNRYSIEHSLRMESRAESVQIITYYFDISPMPLLPYPLASFSSFPSGATHFCSLLDLKPWKLICSKKITSHWDTDSGDFTRCTWNQTVIEIAWQADEKPFPVCLICFVTEQVKWVTFSALSYLYHQRPSPNSAWAFISAGLPLLNPPNWMVVWCSNAPAQSLKQ